MKPLSGRIFIKQIWSVAINWDIFFLPIPAMIGAEFLRWREVFNMLFVQR
tara:strand:- start:428 stop:577 length:150 start_codon:yes stop_codon:yes gene_type:complete